LEIVSSKRLASTGKRQREELHAFVQRTSNHTPVLASDSTDHVHRAKQARTRVQRVSEMRARRIH